MAWVQYINHPCNSLIIRMLGNELLSTILAAEDWTAITDIIGLILKIQEFGSLTDLSPILTPFPILADRLAISGFDTVYDLSLFLDMCRLAAGHLPPHQEPPTERQSAQDLPIEHFPSLGLSSPLKCRSCPKVSTRRCDQTQCRQCCLGCSYHPCRK